MNRSFREQLPRRARTTIAMTGLLSVMMAAGPARYESGKHPEARPQTPEAKLDAFIADVGRRTLALTNQENGTGKATLKAQRRVADGTITLTASGNPGRDNKLSADEVDTVRIRAISPGESGDTALVVTASTRPESKVENNSSRKLPFCDLTVAIDAPDIFSINLYGLGNGSSGHCEGIPKDELDVTLRSATDIVEAAENNIPLHDISSLFVPPPAPVHNPDLIWS